MARRKLIAFEDETFQALDLLSRDAMKSFQELADEAFRDLLKKHRRPDDLRAALKASSRSATSSKDNAKAAQARPDKTSETSDASRPAARRRRKQ